MDRNMTLYVGNLPLDVTEVELRQEFIIFGEVKSVHIMNDKDIGSGQPKGYGFIEMPQQSEGKAAITGLDSKMLKGRVIKVIEALPLSDSGNSGSYKGRKGYRFTRRGRQRTK